MKPNTPLAPALASVALPTLALAALLLVATCSATIIRVPSEQATIGAAIAAASAGDTVLIACDTYHEHSLVLTIPLVFASETGDPSCVVIDGDYAGRILWIEGVSDVLFYGITFMEGQASFGGAVYSDTSDVTYLNCFFTSNYASVEGAGTFHNAGTLTMGNCAFMFNQAVNSGGGAVVNKAGGTLTECVFTNNQAKWGGGVAVYHPGADPVFDDCTFVDNDAPGGDSYGGGAYAWNYAAPTFTDCDFTSNWCEYYGGGLCSDTQCEVVVTNCDFVRNEAEIGGGVAVWQPAGGSVTGCTFDDNTASLGGGAAYDESHAMPISDCTFIGNEAYVAGGGFASYDSSIGPSGCTFFENTGQIAGAIAIEDCASTLISGCSLARNGATGPGTVAGGVGVMDAAVTLEQCVIAFCTGGEAVACQNGTATAIACDIAENPGGDWVGCIAGQETGNDNMHVDPLFCAVFDGDLTLCSNSECLQENNGAGLQIGAHGQGCGECTDAVEPVSWGAIKAFYR